MTDVALSQTALTLTAEIVVSSGRAALPTGRFEAWKLALRDVPVSSRKSLAIELLAFGRKLAIALREGAEKVLRQLADLAGILLAPALRKHDGFESSTSSSWSKFAGATTQTPRTKPTETVKLQHLAEAAGAALEPSRPRWVPNTRPHPTGR
ncbi:MAG: hypothetical protein HY791_34830 [Deltaproteobacteria bacterium]|nr:hypothetical protein [Deltaproteobacteria bacterium]